MTVIPGRGQRPTAQRTGDLTLDNIQRDTRDLSDQLEDFRRGLVVGSVQAAVGNLEIGEKLIVNYNGPGGHTYYLPKAALRGNGRGMWMEILHSGQGLLTISGSRGETVNGFPSFKLPAGQMALLVSDGATAWRASSNGDASDFNSFVHPSSGGAGGTVYIAGMVNTTALAAMAIVANVLYVCPFIAPRKGGSIDQLSWRVTTGGAGLARIGLWENTSEANLYPSARLADSGDISVAAAATKTFTPAARIPLRPGDPYYLSYISNVAHNVQAMQAGGLAAFWGLDAALGNFPRSAINIGVAYGALPATFPAGATYLVPPPIPAMAFRMPV